MAKKQMDVEKKAIKRGMQEGMKIAVSE